MNLSDDKIPVFCCLREFDAAHHRFRVPEGSKLRKCELCTSSVWLQRSCMKLLEKRRKHYIVCFQCMEQVQKKVTKQAEAEGKRSRPADVHIIPEAMPEYVVKSNHHRLQEIFGRNMAVTVWGMGPDGTPVYDKGRAAWPRS